MTRERLWPTGNLDGDRTLVPTVELVEELLSDGLNTRAVVAELARHGITIGRITVRRIQSGTYRKPKPSTGRLEPGETNLAEPERCPECGNNLSVKPCRRCRVKQARALFARHRRIHAALPPPPYTTSLPRGPINSPPVVDELSSQLEPDQAARLEQIRRARPA